MKRNIHDALVASWRWGTWYRMWSVSLQTILLFSTVVVAAQAQDIPPGKDPKAVPLGRKVADPEPIGPYEYFRFNLAWLATIALLWPLNIPLAALAYKIRQGHAPISMEPQEFWLRCTFATLFLELVTIGTVGLDYFLAEDADLPAGVVHIVVFVGYGAVAWWLFFIMFALEDPFQGLSMFCIYLYLPMMVLFLVNKMFGLWNPLLNLALGWLKTT
jgi:hypothetical protein